MHMSIIVPAAIIMGLISVELFVRFWFSVLGLVGVGVMKARGQIKTAAAFRLFHDRFLHGALAGSMLLLCFFLYSRQWHLGYTEPEMIAYLIAAVTRTVMILKDVGARVDNLLEPPEER